MDHTEKLPDDALAAILARLSPPEMARSRCVRKAWRAAVDGHRLLLPHLLPHSVEGIFASYTDCYRPHYLARPSTQHPGVDYGNLHFLPGYVDDVDTVTISDHCNGLLLYGDTRAFCAVNPATRRWERLPPCMDSHGEFHTAYLAFDPTVSLHYEVFLIPSKDVGLFDLTDCKRAQVPPEQLVEKHFTLGWRSLSKVPWSVEVPQHSVEWPPPVLTLQVFSSDTSVWKERSFAREGGATTRVVNVRGYLSLIIGDTFNLAPRWRYSVYFHEALHVLLCGGAFVTRLSLSSGKYDVIRTPVDAKESKVGENYLGILGKDVYYAKIDGRIRIWTLSESSGQVYWVPKNNISLEPLANISSLKPKGPFKPWILDDNEVLDEYGNNKMRAGQDFDWDSDDGYNILDTKDGCRRSPKRFTLLGFHPYKEVAFFLVERFKVVAYNLDSSKLQYIGNLCPSNTDSIYMAMGEAFLYTPCLIGDLKENANKVVY